MTEPPPDVPVPLPELSDEQRAELQRLAEAVTVQRWQAYFTVHGDPMIVPADVPIPARRVAMVSVGFDDYGRAACEFIGATDPATVLALLAEVTRLSAANAELRSEVHGWETDWPRFIRERKEKLAHTDAAMRWLSGALGQAQSAMRRTVDERDAARAEVAALAGQLAKVRAQMQALIGTCAPLTRFVQDELGEADYGDHAGFSWNESAKLGDLSEIADAGIRGALAAAVPPTTEEP